MTTRKNESVDAICHEVRAAGIKPVVTRTNHHLRISWLSRDRIRYCIVPSTPSDYRSVLNSRALARRLLRADGHQPVRKEAEEDKSSVLERIFQVPEQKQQEPLAARVKRLEQQLEALTDLYLEQQAATVDMVIGDRRYVAYPVDNSGAAGVSGAEERHTPKKRQQRHPLASAKQQVLMHLEYQVPKSPREIAHAIGRPSTSVSSCLHQLRAEGLADNIQHGRWVRLPEKVPGMDGGESSG